MHHLIRIHCVLSVAIQCERRSSIKLCELLISNLTLSGSILWMVACPKICHLVSNWCVDYEIKTVTCFDGGYSEGSKRILFNLALMILIMGDWKGSSWVTHSSVMHSLTQDRITLYWNSGDWTLYGSVPNLTVDFIDFKGLCGHEKRVQRYQIQVKVNRFSVRI